MGFGPRISERDTFVREAGELMQLTPGHLGVGNCQALALCRKVRVGATDCQMCRHASLRPHNQLNWSCLLLLLPALLTATPSALTCTATCPSAYLAGLSACPLPARRMAMPPSPLPTIPAHLPLPCPAESLPGLPPSGRCRPSHPATRLPAPPRPTCPHHRLQSPRYAGCGCGAATRCPSRDSNRLCRPRGASCYRADGAREHASTP